MALANAFTGDMLSRIMDSDSRTDATEHARVFLVADEWESQDGRQLLRFHGRSDEVSGARSVEILVNNHINRVCHLILRYMMG